MTYLHYEMRCSVIVKRTCWLFGRLQSAAVITWLSSSLSCFRLGSEDAEEISLERLVQCEDGKMDSL